MKVYISGPISGVKDAEDTFSTAVEYLTFLGYSPLNPMDIPAPKVEGLFVHDSTFSLENRELWAYYMRRAVKMLMSADSVYFLEGWEASVGAKIEHQLAKDLSIPALFETEDINRV